MADTDLAALGLNDAGQLGVPEILPPAYPFDFASSPQREGTNSKTRPTVRCWSKGVVTVITYIIAEDLDLQLIVRSCIEHGSNRCVAKVRGSIRTFRQTAPAHVMLGHHGRPIDPVGD